MSKDHIIAHIAQMLRPLDDASIRAAYMVVERLCQLHEMLNQA